MFSTLLRDPASCARVAVEDPLTKSRARAFRMFQIGVEQRRGNLGDEGFCAGNRNSGARF